VARATEVRVTKARVRATGVVLDIGGPASSGGKGSLVPRKWRHPRGEVVAHSPGDAPLFISGTPRVEAAPLSPRLYSSGSAKGSSLSSSPAGGWAASRLSNPPADMIFSLISSVISGLSLRYCR